MAISDERIRQLALRMSAHVNAKGGKAKPKLKVVGKQEPAGAPKPQGDCVALPLLDPSPRARDIRRISEIVNARAWQIEVTRALDQYGASYVSDLSDEAIAALRERLESYEDCAQVGFELHESPASCWS